MKSVDDLKNLMTDSNAMANVIVSLSEKQQQAESMLANVTKELFEAKKLIAVLKQERNVQLDMPSTSLPPAGVYSNNSTPIISSLNEKYEPSRNPPSRDPFYLNSPIAIESPTNIEPWNTIPLASNGLTTISSPLIIPTAGGTKVKALDKRDYIPTIQPVSIPNGTNGTHGINDTNGSNGLSGMNSVNRMGSASGPNGLNGMNSVNRMNGVNGTNGMNGVNGVNGTKGTVTKGSQPPGVNNNNIIVDQGRNNHITNARGLSKENTV